MLSRVLDQLPFWINPLWILLGAALGLHGLWKTMSRGTIALYIFATLALAFLSLNAGLRQQHLQQQADNRIREEQTQQNKREREQNQEAQELNKQLAVMSEQESAIYKQLNHLTQISTPDTTKPDIGIVWLDKIQPTLGIVNDSSKKTIDRPKYEVVLFNLDVPNPSDPNHRPTIVPIPVQTGDFIRPNEMWGPNDIFSQVAGSLKPGNRLFGFTRAMCPECEKDRDFWVYIVWKEGGWYAPVTPKDSLVNLDTLFKLTPTIAQNSEQTLKQIVPVDTRIEIKNRQ